MPPAEIERRVEAALLGCDTQSGYSGLLLLSCPRAYRASGVFQALKGDDAATKSDGDGLRPILRPEFFQDALDVYLDGVLGNR